MGIYSRDYLREDYGPHRGGWTSIDVIKWLIIVNVAVFVLQVVWQGEFIHRTEVPIEGDPDYVQQTAEEIKRWPGIVSVEVAWKGEREAVIAVMRRDEGPVINEWLALDRSAVFKGQVWRVLTYEFLHDHGSPWHLFFNMLFLYMAGRKVGDFYGPRELLLFYLVAGGISGLLSVFWYEFFGVSGWSAVGASGSVAAVFLLYALNWPFDVWRIMGIIPIQAMWLAIIVAIYDIFPILTELGGNSYGDGVAHSAHLGGMVFALLYQRRDWRLEPFLTRFRLSDWKRRVRPRSKLRVYQPTTEDVDWERRVDELLQKVAEHGEASLTESERAILVDASQRYKQRKG